MKKTKLLMATFLVLTYLFVLFDGGGPVLAGSLLEKGRLAAYQAATEEYIHYSLLYHETQKQNPIFTVTGEVMEEGDGWIRLWGTAVNYQYLWNEPIEGQVLKNSNIIVHGVRSNYPYYQGNHYYSHTTSGTNAFGSKVPIYVYVTGNEAVYRAKAASDQALQKQGQARDALIDTVNEAFRAYIEKEPEDLSRRILYGYALWELAAVMDRRIDEHMQKPFMEKALEQFDVVLEMEPDNPDALFASSILHYKFGYHKKTIERFEGLLKVGRELPGLDVIPEEDSHLRLIAHFNFGDYAAVRALQPSVQLEDYFSEYFSIVFKAEELANQAKAALESKDNGRAFNYIRLALDALASVKDLPKRSRDAMFERGFVKERHVIDYGSYLRVQARVLSQMGDYSLAASTYQELLKNDKQDAELAFEAAKAFFFAGWEYDAEKALKQAIALDEQYDWLAMSDSDIIFTLLYEWIT